MLRYHPIFTPFLLLVQEQKKLIEDIIAEEATIKGLECVECKVFK